MKKNLKTIPIHILMTILVVVSLFGVMFVYDVKIEKSLDNHLQEHHDEIIKPSVININNILVSQIKYITDLTEIISYSSSSLSNQDYNRIINNIKKDEMIESCAIYLEDGSVFGNSNLILNKTHQPSILKMNDETLLISAPILTNNQYFGWVEYEYKYNELKEAMGIDFFNSNGQFAIVDSQGDKVTGEITLFSNYDNLFDFIRSDSREDLGNVDFANIGSSFMITSKMLDEKILMGTYKLGVNNWYLVSAVPEKTAKLAFQRIFDLEKDMITAIYLVLLCYIVLYLVWWYKSRIRIDALTKAYRLRPFMIKAKHLLKNNQMDFVFVKLDVKNFKLINRIYSKEYGDKVLVSISNALRKILDNKYSIYCREQKDTFIFVLPFISKEALLIKRKDFLEEFYRNMNESFNYQITFPTGHYIVRKDNLNRLNISETIEKVNLAHGLAKYETGEDLFIDYEESLEKELIKKQNVENEMTQALKDKEFTLYLQPKVLLENEEIYGAEALVRWVRNNVVYRNPNDFIPIFEKNGFVTKIDFHMFEETVKLLSALKKEKNICIPISVNFSRMHLKNDDIAEQLDKITSHYQVENKYLTIEVTESMMNGDIEEFKKWINSLRMKGFKIAVDDFGIGYSSLSLLKDLHFDELKIDKEFFSECLENERCEIVIMSTIEMAKKLGSHVVAEGIENVEQIEMLKEAACDLIQGYYYYSPMNVSTFTDVITKERENNESR